MINAFGGFEPQVELFESTCIVRKDNLVEERKHRLDVHKNCMICQKSEKSAVFLSKS